MSEAPPSTISEAPRKESREHITQKYAPFLAGIFEAGGYMTLDVERRNYKVVSGERKVSTRVFPIIEFSDNKEEDLIKFKDIFGGGLVPHPSKNSFRWYLKHGKAADLVETIAPYAPSRREFADACKNLQNESDLEEKIRIAQEAKQMNANRFAKLSPEDYSELVKNPLFLAGIFASGRARLRPINPYSKQLSLEINTENVNLLIALQKELGGQIPEVEGASPETILSGVLPASLNFEQQETSHFLDKIQHNFPVNPNEDLKLAA